MGFNGVQTSHCGGIYCTPCGEFGPPPTPATQPLNAVIQNNFGMTARPQLTFQPVQAGTAGPHFTPSSGSQPPFDQGGFESITNTSLTAPGNPGHPNPALLNINLSNTGYGGALTYFSSSLSAGYPLNGTHWTIGGPNHYAALEYDLSALSFPVTDCRANMASTGVYCGDGPVSIGYSSIPANGLAGGGDAWTEAQELYIVDATSSALTYAGLCGSPVVATISLQALYDQWQIGGGGNAMFDFPMGQLVATINSHAGGTMILGVILGVLYDSAWSGIPFDPGPGVQNAYQGGMIWPDVGTGFGYFNLQCWTTAPSSSSSSSSSLLSFESVYTADGIMNSALGQAYFTGNYLMGFTLWTTIPNATGTTGAEVSGSGYGRVYHMNTNTPPAPPNNYPQLWSAPSNGEFTNLLTISFGAATGSWGTVKGLCLIPLNWGDPGLMVCTLANPMTVDAGTVVSFPPGSIVVREAPFPDTYECATLSNAMLNEMTPGGANQTWASNAKVTLALWAAKPGQDGTGGVELAGGGYQRPQFVNNYGNSPPSTWSFAMNSPGRLYNQSVLAFPRATSAWGTANYVSINDLSGNILYVGPLIPPAFIDENATPVFNQGGLIVNEGITCALTSATTITAPVNAAFSYQITATNTPTAFAIMSGSLPPGLILNATNGLISGTPTTAGVYYFYIQVGNATGGNTWGMGNRETFTITNTVPTLASISPTQWPVGWGTTITLTGTGFLNGVTYGQLNGNSYATTWISPTQVSINMSGAYFSTVATLPVTAFNPTPGGGTSAQLPFDIIPGPPYFYSSSPNSGTHLGGTPLTLVGGYFTGATAVTFNGTPAASFAVTNDQHISATTPAGTVGAATISVITPYGTGSSSTIFAYS